jgi:hypothetical protein
LKTGQWVLSQRLGNHAIDSCWDIRVERTRLLGDLFHLGAHHRKRSIPLKQFPAREHFVHNRADRIDIRARV